VGKITVTKPFTYYIDGYQRRDFAIGEYEVPYDCAAYATQSGFAKVETKKAESEDTETKGDERKDGGADKPGRSKKAPAS
jgi:hypothetical protein